MSFIKGKQNLYSIISNSVIKQIQTIQQKNILSNPNFKLYDTVSNPNSFNDPSNNPNSFNDPSNNPNSFNGMPTSLIVTSSLNIDCGDVVNCYNCMKMFGITDDNLTGNNYSKNIDLINNIRNNQCAGSCSCNIQKIDLSDTMIFAVGYSINGDSSDVTDITNNIIQEMTTYNSSSKSTSNWLYSFLGVPGITYGTAPDAGVVAKNINDSMKRVVKNITLLFNQTINQLLTSVQILEIRGTGIQIKNLSLSTVQNITMSAIQNDNCRGGMCIDDDLSSIVNNLVSTLSTSIQGSFSTSWQYAYQQNKALIIGAIIFIPLLIGLYLFLIFKKAATKKSG